MDIKVRVSVTTSASGHKQKVEMRMKIVGPRTVGTTFETTEGPSFLVRNDVGNQRQDGAGMDAADPSPAAVAAGTRAFLARGNADRLGRSLATAYKAMDEVRLMERGSR